MDPARKRILLGAVPTGTALLLLVLMLTTGARTLPLPGEQLPGLAVTALDGTKASLRTGGKTIILVFSTDCPHCQQMLLQVSDLYATGRRRVTLLGISLSNHAATLSTMLRLRITFPVVLAEPALVRKTWRLRHVPALIAVDGGGTVEGCWPGPTSSRHLAGLLREFAGAP